MFYLIDGYTLLYAMGVLRKRMGPDGLEKARQKLLGVLHGSFGDESANVTVDFDAARPPPRRRRTRPASRRPTRPAPTGRPPSRTRPAGPTRQNPGAGASRPEKVRSRRAEIPMIRVRCPICERWMEGQSAAEWPEFPFCSRRCKTIDLGRWLGESYRIPTEEDGEDAAAGVADEKEIP